MEPLHLHSESVSAVSAREGRARSSGFTLIEIVVVLTILVTISSIVFASQSSFNKTLILANTAYDVALALRGAAMYGLGGYATSMVPTGYGMHFERSTPGSFTLFADTYPAPSALSACHAASDPSALDAQPGNCSYESGQDTTVTTYALGNNITVSDFCAYASGVWSCAYAQGGGLTALDIVFARPDSDPFMSVNRSYSAVSPITNTCLVISSPLGGGRFVSVSSTGRITASAASCP